MNKPLKVIVDADAIIAQADPNDKHHLIAAKISEFLSKANAEVIYPATAIAESNAYIQRVLGSTTSAYETAIVFADSNILIAEINHEIIKNALKYFNPKTSKKNTLFDCIIAAIAKEKQADAIFSFDKFYPKNGFKLASDLQV